MVDKKVLANSGIYTVCNFLLKGFSFLLLPLYTAYLTTADYGVTNLMDGLKTVMLYVGTLSLASGVVRLYFDYRGEEQRTKRFVGTVFSFTLFSSAAWCILMCIVQQWLMPTLFQGVGFYPTMVITLVGIVFANIYNVYQQLLRAMEKAKQSAVFAIGYFFLITLLTILFIVFFSWGANGVLAASAIASVLFSLIAMIDLWRKRLIEFCIDLSMLKDMLSYSIPLLPHNLSTQITALVSSIMINNAGSLVAVGLYGIASKFGIICDMLQSSVSSAYQPWLFRLLKDGQEDTKEQVRSFTEVLLWVFAVIFVGMGLYIQEVIFLFLDTSYHDAWVYVPLIIGVYSIKTIYYFYIGILFYYKKAAKFIFVATLSSSLLNLVLSILLIPAMGIYGSILADAISMLLRVALVVWMSRKVDNIGYSLWQFVRVTLIIAVVLTAGLFLSYTQFVHELSLANIMWKTAVYLAFLIVVCLTHKNSVKRLVASVTFRTSLHFKK